MKTLVFIALLAAAVSAQGTKCRALCLAGGHDNGAYQAGAIVGLIQNRNTYEVEWDVVTGNGVGAINAMMLSQYPKGQESEAATSLLEFWNNFQYKQFYEDWYGWYITGLLDESGLYNSAPMNQTINKIYVKQAQRFLGVGATDLKTGKYAFFNSSGQTTQAMKYGVMASAADPVWFPYVNYTDLKLVSGTVKFTVDIDRAVDACHQMGYSNSNIEIDTILVSNKKIQKVDASTYTSIPSLKRYLEIVAYDGVMRVYNVAIEEYPQANFKTLIAPGKKLPETEFPYDYSYAQLRESLDIGIADAKNTTQVPQKDLVSQ